MAGVDNPCIPEYDDINLSGTGRAFTTVWVAEDGSSRSRTHLGIHLSGEAADGTRYVGADQFDATPASKTAWFTSRPTPEPGSRARGPTPTRAAPQGAGQLRPGGQLLELRGGQIPGGPPRLTAAQVLGAREVPRAPSGLAVAAITAVLTSGAPYGRRRARPRGDLHAPDTTPVRAARRGDRVDRRWGGTARIPSSWPSPCPIRTAPAAASVPLGPSLSPTTAHRLRRLCLPASTAAMALVLSAGLRAAALAALDVADIDASDIDSE